ncbi:cytidine deaminase-like fold-containing protein [Pseudomonas monteilii]
MGAKGTGKGEAPYTSTVSPDAEAVCGYCRGDIAVGAEKAGLKYLEVNEVVTGKTLYWKPGMRSIRELN